MFTLRLNIKSHSHHSFHCLPHECSITLCTIWSALASSRFWWQLLSLISA